ncbi:hypothetical protein ACN4EE_02370 [Geminocystis sp. CENA526]|uniref:hypothetical protein n=1 Tax=Geminocystis sp. CENA526 TaxID=1355871 RepID=UPI003D6FEE12
MKVSTLPKYSINPPPTEKELKRAKELMKIAFANVEKNISQRKSKTKEESIKEFEELRQKIIIQCEENGTL